jgi:hypothetical protein
VRPKSPIDELIDILLYLPCCLAIETQLKSLNGDDNRTLREELAKKLIDQLEQPIVSLSVWWTKHHADIIEYHNSSMPFTISTMTVPSPELFKSPIAATTLVYFSTVQVMITRLLAITTPSSQLDKLIIHYISFALSAISYHRAYGTYSGGTFMLIYPMKVFLFQSPCPNQRKVVQQLLLAWGQERGVEGVCANGAPVMQRPGHVS